MREIKFREWQHQEKKMYHIDLHNEALLSTNKHDVLMQWTGLKDKNGVDIYEGDIVNLDGVSNKNPKIEFIDGSFFIVGYGEISLWVAQEWCSIEVIGNIYENKEL